MTFWSLSVGVQERETPGGHSLSEIPHLHGFYFQEPLQFSQIRAEKDPLMDVAG